MSMTFRMAKNAHGGFVWISQRCSFFSTNQNDPVPADLTFGRRDFIIGLGGDIVLSPSFAGSGAIPNDGVIRKAQTRRIQAKAG